MDVRSLSGARWIAALRSDMDLVCRGKVTVNEAWEAWRKYLYCECFFNSLLAGC